MEIRQNSIDEIERVGNINQVRDALAGSELEADIEDLLAHRRNASQDMQLQEYLQVAADALHLPIETIKRYYGMAI